MVTLPIAKLSDEERRAASQSDGLFYLRQRRPGRLSCVSLASFGEIDDPGRVFRLSADICGLENARVGRDLCHSVMRLSGTAVWTGAPGSAGNMGPPAAGIRSRVARA
jgi:hypothetical protein